MIDDQTAKQTKHAAQNCQLWRRTQDRLHISIEGIWDSAPTKNVYLTTRLTAGSIYFGARVEDDLSARLSNNCFTGDTSFYDCIRAIDFEIYGGSVHMSMPLN